jgi:hypothetical protein
MTAGRWAAKELGGLHAAVAGDDLLVVARRVSRQVALAAKGNGPAQRAVIEAVQTIEREIAAQINATAHAKGSEMSGIEVARRIAFLLAKPLA